MACSKVCNGDGGRTKTINHIIFLQEFGKFNWNWVHKYMTIEITNANRIQLCHPFVDEYWSWADNAFLLTYISHPSIP